MGIQRYKCASCGKRFKGGDRLNSQKIWEDYFGGKQTYEQLAQKYGCSKRQFNEELTQSNRSAKLHFQASLMC